MAVEERFWSRVNKEGPVPDFAPHLGNCWIWTGSVNASGKGQAWDGKTVILSHHFVVGKPPKGLEWDHLCRIPPCVRPDHLELVTHQENMRRGFWGLKTHCPKGHPYDERNTYLDRKGKRVCRICRNARAAVAHLKSRRDRQARGVEGINAV